MDTRQILTPLRKFDQ